MFDLSLQKNFKLTIMKNGKNLFRLMLLAVSIGVVTMISSCKDDKTDPTPIQEGATILTGNITANQTLSASTKYLLKGNVFVASGVTLTIEPGTIIFGDKLTKGALIIERGAKIDANGTIAKPIIFTSSAPAINRNYGDWGGVVLLGKAQNNQSEKQPIEGISATNKGEYGGTADDDNSGTMTYVRIEFAGIALTTDNELNGLTFGSVGNGTTINHIQVSYSGDDSYEWFGGTVNATHLVAYRGWDDDFDTDYGFRGNVQFAVSFRDPSIADRSGSNGFESDNDGGASAKLPKTAAKFANVSWFGPYASSALKKDGTLNASASNNFQFGAHIRRNTDIQIYNSVFIGSHLEGVHFDKTGANAVFKGNYFGRTGVNVAGAVKKVTTGNDYDDSNFATDNIFEANQSTVDLSSKFVSLVGAMNIDQPSAMQKAGSSLLTGALTVPAGLTQTQYIGAFDATTDWTAGWTNYSPNSTEY